MYIGLEQIIKIFRIVYHSREHVLFRTSESLFGDAVVLGGKWW